MAHHRGVLVTFEGIDGSGKSTQAQRVAEALAQRGHSVLHTLNPGGTPLGQEIRQLVLHYEGSFPMADRAELLLYLADRAQHMAEVVEPALAEGKIVICDRFVDSTVAYQGYGRQLSADFIQTLHHVALGELSPDQTFLLNGPVEALLARAKCRSKADRLEREALAFYERVHQGFEMLAAQHPKRIHVIDALQPLEVITEQIVVAVQARLPQEVS